MDRQPDYLKKPEKLKCYVSLFLFKFYTVIADIGAKNRGSFYIANLFL